MGKRTRRRSRQNADATISAASDESLRNMQAELSRSANSLSAQLAELRRRMDMIANEIEGRKRGTSHGLRISDHAVLRYLERVRGIDMDATREEIAEIAARARVTSDGRYGVREGDGLLFGSDEDTGHITTVMTPREASTVTETGR